MGYSIEYNPEKNRIYPMKAHKKPKMLLIALVVIITVLVLQKLDSNHTVRTLLFPGDLELTSQAFSTMTNDIKQGGSIGDAVTSFCMEIIKNG